MTFEDFMIKLLKTLVQEGLARSNRIITITEGLYES